MTLQRGISIVAAGLAALLTYLVGADMNHEIPTWVMLILGGSSAVFSAINILFTSPMSFARSLHKNPDGELLLKQAAKE